MQLGMMKFFSENVISISLFQNYFILLPVDLNLGTDLKTTKSSYIHIYIYITYNYTVETYIFYWTIDTVSVYEKYFMRLLVNSNSFLIILYGFSTLSML